MLSSHKRIPVFHANMKSKIIVDFTNGNSHECITKRVVTCNQHEIHANMKFHVRTKYAHKC